MPAPARGHACITDPLEPAALRMLESLPAALRLLHLRQGFPHVLNRLARAWREPLRFIDEMEGLLHGIDRPHRQGFPKPVQQELTALLDFYSSGRIHPGLERPKSSGQRHRPG